MGKLNRIIRHTIAEMTGKKSPDTFGFDSGRNSIYGKLPSQDYTRNDYELFRSLYYGSKYGACSVADRYLLGSSFAMPIVESLAIFAMGRGCNITISDGTNKNLEDANQETGQFLKENEDKILDWLIHGYRDGDSYLFLDELCRVDELDAMNVSVVLDPVTSELMGYDVEETIQEEDPQTGNKSDYIILKQYRRDSVRYIKIVSNERTTLYERVFTEDGPQEINRDESGNIVDNPQLVYRELPITPLHNKPEPRATYGNSEYQNLLIFFRQYHSVFEEGIKGTIYNSTPVPVFKGIQDEEAFASDSHSNDTGDGVESTPDERKKLAWGQDSAIYLSGKDSDAKFLQADGVMDDTAKALEFLFLNIVDASQTPEFLFGGAVTSSKASTESQMPQFVQKAENKQKKLRSPIEHLIKSYIDRQISLANPAFLKLKGKEISINVTFPPVLDENQELNQSTLDTLHDRGIISDEFYLTHSVVGQKVDDVPAELAKAKDDAKAATDAANILPDAPNNLKTENPPIPPTPTPTPPKSGETGGTK